MASELKYLEREAMKNFSMNIVTVSKSYYGIKITVATFKFKCKNSICIKWSDYLQKFELKKLEKYQILC